MTDLASELTTNQARQAARRSPTKTLGKLADLLEKSGIDIEDISKIDKVRINEWEGFYKDENNEAQTVQMEAASILLTPVWAEGPQWPVVQQAAPTTVKYSKARATRPEGVKTTVLLPDPQIGYRRYEDGTLDPMHDEKAMAVAVDLIAAVKPDQVVNLGDFLDNAEWSSKFTVLPEFVLVTQPAIDRGHQFLAEQRAAAGPDAHIVLLGGNHDDRIGIAVARNAMAALRLRQANTPEGWPVLSLPFLLRLDDLGVEYVGAYPAGRYKIAERKATQTPLYAIHGEKLDVAKVARAERQSFVQGHAHHVACHSATYEIDGSPEEVQAWSMGCLCRVDGGVPSTKGGSDEWGRPVKRYESWQHAAAVVTETENGWWIEPVRIHNGVAMWRGKEFTA